MIFFETLINTLSYICTISSLASFNFPIILFIRGYNCFEQMPVVVFSLTLINCIFWLVYGVLTNIQIVFITNAIGMVIISMMLSVYWVLYAEKKLVTSLIYNIILFSSIYEIYYIVNSIIGSYGVNTLGLNSIIASIIKVISFCVYIHQSIKRKDEGKQLIYSMVCNCINCLLWVVYYLLMPNKTIAGSFIIELLFSIYLLSKLAFYVKNSWEKNDNSSIQDSALFSKSELNIIHEKEQP